MTNIEIVFFLVVCFLMFALGYAYNGTAWKRSTEKHYIRKNYIDLSDAYDQLPANYRIAAEKYKKLDDDELDHHIIFFAVYCSIIAAGIYAQYNHYDFEEHDYDMIESFTYLYVELGLRDIYYGDPTSTCYIHQAQCWLDLVEGSSLPYYGYIFEWDRDPTVDEWDELIKNHPSIMSFSDILRFKESGD